MAGSSTKGKCVSSMNIYQSPASKQTAESLGFTQGDLERFLRAGDPLRAPRPAGISKHRFAAIPDRADIVLRWTTPIARTFPNFRDAGSLADHLLAYEQRLCEFAAAGLVRIPRHSFFGVFRCPYRMRPVAYTVVERVQATPLRLSADFGRIARLGHGLLAHFERAAPPFLEDHTPLEQYGLTGSDDIALLDLEPYLIDNRRDAIRPLAEWGKLVRPYDAGALQQRVAAVSTATAPHIPHQRPRPVE